MTSPLPSSVPLLASRTRTFRWTCRGLILALLWQLVGCGTLLYPERRGQIGGNLDTSIILLDGLGLIVFFLPGVVAFAVDFATGAIYLPSGRRSQLSPEDKQAIVGMSANPSQQVPQYLSQTLAKNHLIHQHIPSSNQWQSQALEGINQWSALSKDEYRTTNSLPSMK